jgi:surface antigen
MKFNEEHNVILSLRANVRAALTTWLIVLGLTVLGLTLAVAAAPALAEPPPHAKAHGWRKKNDPTYAGYTGKQWPADFGVVSAGRCNTDAVLTAVGGVVGGVIGAQASRGGSEGERAIAIIVGSAIGAVVGNKIGREIDRTDQACIGHALELGQDGRPVVWTNPQTRVAYNLMPLRGDGGNCRNFKLDAMRDGKSESVTRRACRTADGVWQLQ